MLHLIYFRPGIKFLWGVNKDSQPAVVGAEIKGVPVQFSASESADITAKEEAPEELVRLLGVLEATGKKAKEARKRSDEAAERHKAATAAHTAAVQEHSLILEKARTLETAMGDANAAAEKAKQDAELKAGELSKAESEYVESEVGVSAAGFASPAVTAMSFAEKSSSAEMPPSAAAAPAEADIGTGNGGAAGDFLPEPAAAEVSVIVCVWRRGGSPWVSHGACAFLQVPRVDDATTAADATGADGASGRKKRRREWTDDEMAQLLRLCGEDPAVPGQPVTIDKARAAQIAAELQESQDNGAGLFTPEKVLVKVKNMRYAPKKKSER